MIFVLNWKQKLNNKESINLALAYNKVFFRDNCKVIISPTTLAIPLVRHVINKDFLIYAQDVSQFEESYNGEISAKLLKESNVDGAIVGHIERRMYLNENGQIINNKIKQCLSNNLGIMLCVGELRTDMSNEESTIIIERQLIEAFKDIKEASNVIIAYESIDTMYNSSENKLNIDKILFNIEIIKKWVDVNYKNSDIKVIYGGSVNISNIMQFTNYLDYDIDGIAIGSSSTNIDDLTKIIEMSGYLKPSFL